MNDEDEGEVAPRTDVSRVLMAGAVFVLGGTVSIYCGTQQTKVDKQREAWNAVACTVMTSRAIAGPITECRGWRKEKCQDHHAEIRVQYRVDGVEYRELAGFVKTTSTPDQAVALANSYAAGADLVCSVNPQNPRAIHLPLEGHVDKGPLGGTTLFLGLVLFAATLAATLRVWRWLTPRPLPDDDEVDYSHLNRPPGA